MENPAGSKHYFNSASHSLPTNQTYRAIAEYLDVQSQIGPSAAALHFADEIARARENCARVLNADADRLALSSTTTSAWQAIFPWLDLTARRVLVTQNEWGDYYRALAVRPDIQIEILPAIDHHSPDLSAWENAIDDDVAAIMLPMVTSLSGQRYPVEKIAALPRPAHTRLIVDAAQAIGQVPVDLGRINCDALIATCRKWLRGPRQTSLLWISPRWQTRGAQLQPSQLQSTDFNPALHCGLAAATDAYLQADPPAIHRALKSRADKLRSMASDAGFTVFGGELSQSAIVSLEVPRQSLAKVSAAIAAAGYTAKAPDIAHLEPLNPAAGKTAIVRITPHVYSDDTEMAKVVETAQSALNS